jgi:predicted LPLAT superfamily acyltransferase
VVKTKQRGSGWSIKLVFNLYKLFGYKFIYYLMYPVTLFYFIFATNVKEALKIYYKNIGVEFTNLKYYEHLRIFAVTMVDRFISKVDPESYTFIYSDKEMLAEVFSKASIFLQSHFGGWASSANFSREINKVHIVMQEALMDSIKEIENSLDIKTNINVIDLNSGGLSVSIQVANALMKNEVVAIMGDRAASANGIIATKFFGKEAYFNKNPFQIAYKMGTPILIYFAIYQEMKTYKLEFLKIELDRTKSEDEAIQEGVQQYVVMYESTIKQYPNQWLNFYDFWKKQH